MGSGLSAQDILPEGQGRQIVKEVCTQCHDLGLITAKPRTLPQWEYVVQTMIAQGAPLPEEEISTVVNYLATHFGQ